MTDREWFMLKLVLWWTGTSLALVAVIGGVSLIFALIADLRRRRRNLTRAEIDNEALLQHIHRIAEDRRAMPTNKDFKRVRDRVERFSSEPRPVQRETYARVVESALREIREPSEEMILAMAAVEWPEGMSAKEQLRLMFQAAIDEMTRDNEPEPRP